jgi:hypothetical protein
MRIPKNVLISLLTFVTCLLIFAPLVTYTIKTIKIQRKIREKPKLLKIFPSASTLYKKKHNLTPTNSYKNNNSFLNRVTISTQLTMERLHRLVMISNIWKFKISAVIYIILYNDDLSEIDPNVHLESIYSKFPQLLHTVDLSLVFGKSVAGEFPMNTLRNIAWDQVTTEFIFLLDVDFIPSSNFEKTFENLDTTFLEKPKSLFVIPAFHFECENVNELNSCNVSDPILETHPSHNATDIARWRNSTSPFQISYKFLYEPYVITNRNITRYNEDFDIGNDKVEHFYELAAQNFSFYILPHVYISHLPHTDEVKWSLDSKHYDPLRAWFKLAKFMRVISEKYGYNHFCTMSKEEEDLAQTPGFLNFFEFNFQRGHEKSSKDL